MVVGEAGMGHQYENWNTTILSKLLQKSDRVHIRAVQERQCHIACICQASGSEDI